MVALEEDQKFQIVLANLKLVWNIGGLVEEDSFFFCLKKSKDGANLRDVLAVFMTNTAGRRNFPFSTSLY